jgi:hypothetical protein
MIDAAIFLCDKTGIMARPWANAGYRCYCVDIQHSIRKDRIEGNIHYVWGDVRSWTYPRGIRPIFGASFTECTNVAGSGARDFEKKGGYLLRDGLEQDGQAELASESRVRVRTASGEDYDRTVRDIRTITSPGAVQNSGYNAARGDLLLAERITDTKHRAEEVAVFVGPLLPELRKAVFENATAKEIGESLGFSGPQASAVGNALLQRALEAAGDAYDRIRKRERKKLTYSDWLNDQPDGMPIPARKAKRSFEAANAENNKPANDNKPKEVIGARRWRTAA